MKMRGTYLFLACATVVMLFASPTMAQEPSRIAQNNAWGSYSAAADGGKTCYILSIPSEKPQPTDRDHGDVFFMLAQHPGQSSTLEPQFKVGYPFKDDSKVTLEIDGRKFTMFTRGDSAWLENPAEEAAVVDSMRSGKNMSLIGFSRRGTQTSYVFSLSGVSASLKDIASCK
jgi:hypothetical protein